MKTEQASPVCVECHRAMFKKIIKSSSDEKDLTGWSCPECFITKWGWEE